MPSLDIEGTTGQLSTLDSSSPTTEDSPAAIIPSANPGKSLPTATKQSKEAIIELVRVDLAQRLKTNASEIEVINLESRTWPDTGLGCAVRKGLFIEQPIPGYRILLTYLGITYEYHTSLGGTFRFCPYAEKPLDPIK